MLVGRAVQNHSANMTSTRGNRGSVNSVLLGCLSFFCAVAVLSPPARACQPIWPAPDLPGMNKGKVEAYWIGPYVRLSEARIGKRGATMVTWFKVNSPVWLAHFRSTVARTFI